eukprot:COSAG01_NODE_62811_length_282_cov_12.426230_1_plen_93_part_11
MRSEVVSEIYGEIICNSMFFFGIEHNREAITKIELEIVSTTLIALPDSLGNLRDHLSIFNVIADVIIPETMRGMTFDIFYLQSRHSQLEWVSL